MKLTLLLLLFGMILSGCAREQVPDAITMEQQNAVREMQRAYQQARAYNDSLASAQNANLSTAMVSYYDTRYHHYDAAFTTCHNGYTHTQNAADHSHDGQGKMQLHGTGGSMMGNGGMMRGEGCGCCSNGGHSADIHSQMETLHRLHALYHP